MKSQYIHGNGHQRNRQEAAKLVGNEWAKEIRQENELGVLACLWNHGLGTTALGGGWAGRTFGLSLLIFSISEVVSLSPVVSSIR